MRFDVKIVISEINIKSVLNGPIFLFLKYTITTVNKINIFVIKFFEWLIIRFVYFLS